MKSQLKKSMPLWPFIVGLLVVIAGGAWYWWMQQHKTVSLPPDTPSVAKPSPDAQATPPPPVTPLPPPEQTDDQLRNQMAKITSDPNAQAWMREDDLVRRFVSAVRLIADGESPHLPLGFLAPTGAFNVIERNGSMVVDPVSFQRYDLVANAIASVDVSACSGAYATLRPLLESAYREIGEPGTTFEPVLAKALQRLINTPVPDEEIAVQYGKNSAMYEFVNGSLQALSPAQKHLLRMGPKNMRLIQNKLKEIESALHLNAAPNSGK
jgi:hypothetical protein